MPTERGQIRFTGPRSSPCAGGAVAMAGDGQVTMGATVMKSNARKIRKIYDGKILVGFAGATADAFTLFERFEGKVKEYGGDITRAAVELAKDWRTDRILRRLEALLLVADKKATFLISGTGDVIEPDEGVIAIGSGGSYRLRGGARVPRRLEARGARDRGEVPAHRGGDLHLYQRRDPRGGAGMSGRNRSRRQRARAHAARDRGGAGQVHHRPGQGQEGRGHCPAQPPAPPAAARRSCATRWPPRTSS